MTARAAGKIKAGLEDALAYAKGDQSRARVTERSLAHDGAASLRVEWLPSRQGVKRSGGSAGWYVVRTCPCHRGEAITAPLDSREDAVVALAMLDEDARNHQ